MADDDQSELFSGITDAIRRGFMGRSSTVAGSIGSSAYEQASELMTTHENMVAGFGENSQTFKHMYAGVSEMQTNFYGMAAQSGEALNTIFENQGELIGEYQGIISSNLLQIHATQKEVTAAEMADLTLYGRALNFGTSQTQKFLERQFALTGEANDELLKQTLAYSNAIEEKTGISSKIIAENVSGMMTDIRTFGNMTVEEMSEAAAAIAKVGLQVDDLGGLVKKFSTFEGAADSVSKLTQVFGVQMDTMKYMTASFESPQDMLAMIQEDFEAAGVDMANMDMAQKRLLADTTGMSISAVESLLGEAGSTLSDFTANVSGATAGVGESEISGALAAAGEDIARINQMGKTVEEGMRRLAARTRRAIGSVFSEGVRTLADEATLLLGNVPRIANLTTRAGKDQLEQSLGVTVIYEQVQGTLDSGRVALGEATTAMEESVNNKEGTAAVSGLLTGFTNTDSGALVVALETDEDIVTTPGSSGMISAGDLSAVTEASAQGSEGQDANIEVSLPPGVTTWRTEDIAVLQAEFDAATNNKMSPEEQSRFAEMIATAISAQPTAPLNITLTDTVDGFEAKLDGAGVVRVNTDS